MNDSLFCARMAIFHSPVTQAPVKSLTTKNGMTGLLMYLFDEENTENKQSDPTRLQKIKALRFKACMNIDAIITTVIFCGATLCSLENRRLTFLFASVLAVFAAIRIIMKRVSFSVAHIPLAVLPLSYILAALANEGMTFYSIGQAVIMCVPLLASLCLPNLRSSLPVIAVGICFFGVASLLGLVIPFIPNTFTPSGFHSDPRARLQTLLNYANTGAILFGCGLFALLGIQAGKLKIVKHLLFIFFMVCMILTGSRMGVAFTLALFVAYLLYQRGAKKVILAVACLSVVSIVTVLIIKPELVIDSSLATRMIYWSDASGAFIGSPVFGLGPEGFIFRIYELQSAIYTVTLVHSAFLQAAVDAGLLALIALLLTSAIALKRALKENPVFFFLLLLLLIHSSVDITMSFVPVLMIIGFTFTCPATAKLNIKAKTAVIAALVPILAMSSYLHIAEGIYSNGIKYERRGMLAEAAEAYQDSISLMSGDFRSIIRLAGVYILRHEQEKAIDLLIGADSDNFNRASRSELLVIAYKNLGRYHDWNTETLALLEFARFKQTTYAERAEYLLAAYYSSLLSDIEYQTEYQTLLGKVDDANRSLHGLSRFLQEKDVSIS